MLILLRIDYFLAIESGAKTSLKQMQNVLLGFGMRVSIYLGFVTFSVTVQGVMMCMKMLLGQGNGERANPLCQSRRLDQRK